MRTLILLFFCLFSLSAQSQISFEPTEKEPKFTGFFVGGTAGTDIFPTPKYMFQFNTGVTFNTRSFLFDIVPIQVSYLQGNTFKFGSSILLRKYLFKK